MGGISLWQLIILALPLAAIYVIYRLGKAIPPAKLGTHPAGVAGWLLLLVAGLLLLGPLINAHVINSGFGDAETLYPNLLDQSQWQTFKSAIWLGFAIATVLSVYAGALLLRQRRPDAVNRVKVLLWLIGPVTALWFALGAPLLVFGAVGNIREMSVQMVAPVLYALLWTSYLSRSKRVRATYFPEDEPAESAR